LGLEFGWREEVNGELKVLGAGCLRRCRKREVQGEGRREGGGGEILRWGKAGGLILLEIEDGAAGQQEATAERAQAFGG
jgi:hypothetical protein